MNPLGKLLVNCSLVFALCAFAAALPAAEREQSATGDSEWVLVEKVEVRGSALGPVVLLVVYNRAIPIFVDPTVAESIQSVLAGEKTPRPLTHELMRRVLEELGGRVAQAQITLKGRTYYADLKLIVDGREKVFDSRSSDAIALAIHFKAPILVPRELLDSNAMELDAGPAI